jgi:diacylglycerol kinase (ATP)
MTQPASSPVPTEPTPEPPRRQRGILASFGHAIEGLVFTAAHQRNMQIHVVAGILVGLVGSGIAFGLAERVTLVFCVVLVLFAEILNSALESLVDLYTETFHERARVVKDAAAAGVLVLALGTVAIFAAILIGNWSSVSVSGSAILKQVLAGVPLAVLASLLLLDRARPAWLDGVAALAGTGLLALLATWTTSAVFTGMTAGLFGLCVVVAWRRH